MSFAVPAALGLLGLLVPLVVLYVLKVRRKRVRVASTWLWLAARRDLQARSPFQRLRVQLPLVLQALALALLALAAARPAAEGRSVLAEHLAIVVDVSASMSAHDETSGKSRMDLARERAHAIVDALGPGADVMLLAAGRGARVVLPPERDVRRLHTAIDGLEAMPVEGDMGEALALAAGRLEQLGGTRTLFVVTDGNLAKPVVLGHGVVPVEVERVGGPVDNAAIVRVDVRAGVDPLQQGDQVQAFLVVANYGAEARELYATMREDNASDVLASRSVVVLPGEKVPVVLTFRPARGDWGRGLVFDISPHDAMPVDDVAFGRVPEGRELPVVVASASPRPSPWLVRALAADRDVDVQPKPLEDLAAGVPPGSFVVLEKSCVPVPGGDLLIVDPPEGPCLGAHVGPAVEAPRLTDWDHGDARLRFVALDGVELASARPVEVESLRQSLVRSDRGTLVADVSTSARFATLVAFDPGESNWPLRASFVVFARNLLEQARLHRSSGLAAPAVAGAPLRAVVPAGVESAELELPGKLASAVDAPPGSGERRVVSARDGLCVAPDLDRVGLYRLAWSKPEPGSLVVAVNLASPAESNLGQQADATAPTTGDDTAAEEPANRREWSFALAAAALLFVLFDLYWLGRPARAVRLAAGARPRPPERRRA